MRYIITCIFAISVLFSPTLTNADYFSEEIIGADPEVGILQDISLHPVSLKDGKEQSRYEKTLTFINSIKNEAVVRFESGEIPLYRRYDIITHLDSFVYNMNQYFTYQKRYEQSKKYIFKETAKAYLQESKGSYNRLKAALKNSAY